MTDLATGTATSIADSAELRLVVTTVQLVAEGVVAITFEDAGGADLPRWEPGAHLDLKLPSGIRRQYSLWGDPRDRRRYSIAVLRERESRGGSREVHDTGLVGRTLAATLRNRFELVERDRYLFIAGGIGITPILPMARRVAGLADWQLYYTGRSSRSMAFVDEVRGLDDARVHIAARDADPRLDLERIVAAAEPGTAIYCCGPNPLLDAVHDAAARLAPGAEVHVERFGASTANAAVRVGSGDARPVEVELRRTGVTIQVAPDQSLLDAIREVVPGTPFSCTEGYCGSCELAVVDGIPDHRDEILTPEERASNRTMFPCVSRALTERLTLDA